jgi:hypothetical protein
MNSQLTTLSPRRSFPFAPFAILSIVFILALAMLVAPTQRPATSVATQFSYDSGAPMTHLTGSVYDGGTYGTLPAVSSSGAPMTYLTGSVYDGGIYGKLQAGSSSGAPMKHLTGSVYEPAP